MKLFFRIAGLFLLLSVTLAQDLGFDLADALDDDKPPKATAPPKKNNDMGFDLSDAFGDDEPPTPKPPVVVPPKSGGGGGGGGGGGTLKDSDLFDVNQGGYEPDGGRVQDPGHDQIDPADQPQEGSGPIAGIISAVGVALVGAASSYFAYQKKKLCFKLQGGQDPESGNRHMTQSEPQVMSNLLQS